MRIESNLSEKVLRITGLLQNQDIPTEKALRMAANDALALVQTRIQQQGQGTSGKLTSKAVTKLGAYSKGWGYNRSKNGRQTGFIDWTFDGDLFRAWQVLKSDNKEAKIGFNDSSMSDRSGWLEAMHGKAFGLTQQEGQLVFQSFMEEYKRHSELI